jgi:hypothetical protein
MVERFLSRYAPITPGVVALSSYRKVVFEKILFFVTDQRGGTPSN